MKLAKYILLCTMAFSFSFFCDDEEVQEAFEDERLNALVTFQHFGDASGCGGTNEPITFVVTYRDIQAFVDLGPGGVGFLTLSVADGESVNVQVRIQSDDDVVADANIAVRTTSRPDDMDGERSVTYCENWALRFENF